MIGPLDTLVRFSREMAGARAPEDIYPVLASAAVSIGCAGAAVLQVEQSGNVALAASVGLADALSGWRAETDVVDRELARRFLLACGGAFEDVDLLPLVSGNDLYGALVLLHREDQLDATQRTLVEALADMAAIAMAKAAQYAALETSYSALRASREALARAEKLRALGQMAAGVSHDLVNIIFPISLAARFVKGRLTAGTATPDAEALEALEGMEATIKRGMETVTRLRDFSRQAPDSTPAALHVGPLIHEAVEICRPRLVGRRARIDLNVVSGVTALVLVRASELVTTLVNLIVNGIEAIGATGASGGGRLDVTSGQDARGVFIRVADNGPGIPEEIRGRIFEPFFTTKGDEGTGLGLAMVYSFARRHGGHVDLESEVGRGTTFTLWFPPAPSGPAREP